MKKQILISLCSLCILLPATAQQDPAAKQILDRVAAKSKQYISIQADFELKIDNRREDFSSNSKGILKIKGEKYYMESPDTKVFFDGTTLWTYMEDINELTITEPDKSSEDFVENPIIIFDMYNRDFKYKLVGEARTDAGWMYEIDLFPNELDQPYSRFKILIRKDTEELYMVQAVGKDGIDYTAYLTNTVYNKPIDDSVFTFPMEKYKKIEVIDLRF